MANPPAQAPLPQELVIGYGYSIVFDAIDPTTGASVAGVNVVNPVVTATDAKGNIVDLTVGNPILLGVSQ